MRKRREHEARLVREGKADRRNYERGEGHDAAFLYPVPFSYSPDTVGPACEATPGLSGCGGDQGNQGALPVCVVGSGACGGNGGCGNSGAGGGVVVRAGAVEEVAGEVVAVAGEEAAGKDVEESSNSQYSFIPGHSFLILVLKIISMIKLSIGA